MTHDRICPPDLFDSKPYGFSQVVAAAPGGRTIYCAGQTAWTKDGQIPGPGDFPGQLTETLHNVERAVVAAGGTRTDITRLTIYVVRYSPDLLPDIGRILGDFFGSDLPANTLIGVETLALPDFLVEVEATAVLAS